MQIPIPPSILWHCLDRNLTNNIVEKCNTFIAFPGNFLGSSVGSSVCQLVSVPWVTAFLVNLLHYQLPYQWTGQNRQAWWGSAMLFARVSSCSQATFHFHRSCVTPSTAPPWRAKRDLLHRRLVGCACNWPTDLPHRSYSTGSEIPGINCVLLFIVWRWLLLWPKSPSILSKVYSLAFVFRNKFSHPRNHFDLT